MLRLEISESIHQVINQDLATELLDYVRINVVAFEDVMGYCLLLGLDPRLHR